MANEAQREEEYMKKMLNRGKDSATTKKNVFGGGLEAARAKQSGGVITSSPVVTTTTTANTYKPPPVRTYNPPPPQSRYVPQSLEAEVTEVSLPYPGSSGYRYEPPDESSIALNSGLSKDEMAKREEERVAKSIGKFVPPVQAGGSGGSFGGPPKPPAAAPKSYHTTNYGGSSYSQPQSGSNYGQQSSGYSAPAHGADYVYPDYQIGTIYPVDNNTNVLPLSPFGCAAHEITLTVRQNGKSLEVKRAVHQKGLPKNETKNITLPFQVLPHNTSASYNPNKNGGELSVFFGKSSDNSGETVVSTFTVYGSPSSHEVKVPMGAEQESDHFLFRPDSPAKYDTHFTVVLIGSILEFRSACTFEDDDGTKTLNTKQTVQLPITPSPEQIESNGDQIKVWFNRMVESNVGDFEVYITPVH